VGDQRWVAHFNDAVHESWRFGKSQDIVIENLPVLDLFFAHVKGTRSAFVSFCADCLVYPRRQGFTFS
jgi:hypothetical protein